MKAILIARVSTEEQREAGNSLPAQVVRLERYCQSKGFSVLKVCSFDESAYTSQRDEFDRIIDFILSQNEKVAVCCDKVDRISRNIFDTRISTLYEKALRDELELHFVSDGQIITSRIGAVEKFQFSISLGLAKYYSDAISDNVKRAQEQKIRKGDWLFKAPYGYLNITKVDGTADIIVDAHVSEIIKCVFEWYATGAYSTELMSKKLKADFNVVWGKGYVAKILSNPFYHGEMIVKGQAYPHRYPPLISKTLFDEVAQVKNSFNKKPVKFAGLPYIYRGLLRCGDCGLAITPEKHKGHVYYHCTQSKGKHGAKWLREETITEELGKVFKALQMPEEVHQSITETLNALHKDKIEFHNMHLDRLTQEQKTITKMMDNLYLDKLKGRITESEYDKFYKSLYEQMTDVNLQIERLQNAEKNYYLTARYLLELSRRAYDLFVGSEIEERRQLIKLVLSNLRIEGENVRFDALKPFDTILNSTDSQQWWGALGLIQATLRRDAYARILQLLQYYEEQMRIAIASGVQAAHPLRIPAEMQTKEREAKSREIPAGEQAQVITELVQGFMGVLDEDKQRKFFNAAQRADVAQLQGMLEIGVDPNLKNAQGNTALMLLLQDLLNPDNEITGVGSGSYYDAAKLLVTFGADVNAKNNAGFSTLWFAAKSHSSQGLVVEQQDYLKNEIVSILFGEREKNPRTLEWQIIPGRDLTDAERKKFVARSGEYEKFADRMSIIRLLLQNGAHLDETIQGLTPLAHAINIFDWYLFKALLTQGIGNDESAQFTAILTDESSLVRELLQAQDQEEIPSDVKNSMRTLARVKNKLRVVEFFDKLDASLIEAVKHNDEFGVLEVLKRGALVDARDHETGATALMEAVQNGRGAIIRALLAYGVNINAQDLAGVTALQHAAMLNKPMIAELLLSAGADPNIPAADGRTFFDIAHMLPQGSPMRNLAEKTRQCMQLAMAAFTGDDHLVEQLLHQNKQLVSCSVQHMSPLMGAVLGRKHSIAETLLEHGADPNKGDVLRQTVILNDIEMADLLLQAGADPARVEQEGITAQEYVLAGNSQGMIALFEAYNAFKDNLFYAFAMGNEKSIVALLLGSPVYVNVKDDADNTPLRLALHNQLYNIAQLLVEKGARVEEHDNEQKMTPLMQAAEDGNLDAVVFLIQHGADINKKDRDGYTALMYAVRANWPEVVRYLISAGASLSLRDAAGHDIFADVQNPELLKMITDIRLSREAAIARDTETKHVAMLAELKRKLDKEEQEVSEAKRQRKK